MPVSTASDARWHARGDRPRDVVEAEDRGRAETPMGTTVSRWRPARAGLGAGTSEAAQKAMCRPGRTVRFAAVIVSPSAVARILIVGSAVSTVLDSLFVQ